MRDIRDQINAQLYGVGVADLPARHAQLHAQLLQNAAFMDGYRKERRTMFKFVRRLIEKALGVPDLRSTLVDAEKLYRRLEGRVRGLELAEVKRTAQVGSRARYRDPARQDAFDAFFGQVATITEVRANGLLIQGGGFVPWSWVAEVEETAVQDAED